MNLFDEKLMEATKALESATEMLSCVEVVLADCRKVNNQGIAPEVSIEVYDKLLHAWFEFCDQQWKADYVLQQIREGE